MYTYRITYTTGGNSYRPRVIHIEADSAERARSDFEALAREAQWIWTVVSDVTREGNTK